MAWICSMMNGSSSLTSQPRRSAVQRFKILENFGMPRWSVLTSFPNVSRFVGHRLMLEPRPQLISLIFVEMVHTHTHCQGIDRNSDAKKPWRLPISIPALLHPDKLPTPEHVLGLLEIPQGKDTTLKILPERANPSNLRCGTQRVYAQALQNNQLKRKLMLVLAFVLKSVGATTMLKWLSFIALCDTLYHVWGVEIKPQTIRASISKMMVDNMLKNETR